VRGGKGAPLPGHLRGWGGDEFLECLLRPIAAHGRVVGQFEENRPSGAKAHDCLAGFMYGLEPVPFKLHTAHGRYDLNFALIARIIVLHGNGCSMKTNVTLKIDADLLREARILAAEQNTSISAIVATNLEEAVRKRKGYEEAKASALAMLRTGFDLKWTPPRSRDELYER